MREEEQAHEKRSNILMNLPKEMKGILPENFNFNEIGAIDLNEAEKIANENVLFLTEKDIIEELDEFDLIPLKDEIPRTPTEAGKKVEFPEDDFDKLLREISVSARGEIPGQEQTDANEIKDIPPAPIGRQEAVAEHLEPAETTTQIPVNKGVPTHEKKESHGDEPLDDGMKWVPLEIPKESKSVNDLHIDENVRWISLENLNLPDGDLKPDHRILGEPEKEIIPAKSEIDETSPVSRQEHIEAVKTETAVERMEHVEPSKPEIVEEKPDVDKTLETAEKSFAGESTAKTIVVEAERTLASIEPKEEIPEDDGDVIWMTFDSKSEQRLQTQGKAEQPEIDSMRRKPAAGYREPAGVGNEIHERQGADQKGISPPKKEQRSAEKDFSIVKEILPDEFLKMGRQDGSVSFIDDRVVEKALTENPAVFEENELDRITSEMVVIDEGKGFLLSESSVSEDRAAIVQSASAFIREHEEVLYEFEEHRYRDDELDYIHSAIIEDDYIRYIREIDEFSVERKADKITTAMEILGITLDEMEDIQVILFGNEYADVNLYEIFDFFSLEGEGRERAGRHDRDCQYFVPSDDSLLVDEKNSIEDDLYASNAFVYEEDVDEIKRLLVRKGGIVPDKIGAITVAESVLEMKPEREPVQVEEVIIEPPPFEMEEEKIDDITDKVLILEDELDVERFVKDFPPAKQKDIKTLLKYLDGLFERLPENIIKRFASSEYFDLYLKILNELGV